MSTLDAEIFAVGKWNGMEFSLDDLNQLAASFASIGDNLRVPLKMGHNDEQPMTDGQPALGWVSKVWVAGDKLMAQFTDLPKVLMEAISKKLYKNVSVELDLDVEYKAESHPYVLTGVALLGADIPAVNTLADLTHYMSRGAGFSAGRRVVFTAIAGDSTGDNNMELKEAIEKIAELTATVATFTTQNAELAAKVVKFEADAKARTDAEAAKAITAKRTEVTELLEAGVKAGNITPAQRTQYAKLIRLDDDAGLAELDIADVKALVGEVKQFSREQMRQGASGEDSDLPVDVRVTNEINALLQKKEATSFFAAQSLVFARNPTLAREYANFNDKE